MQDYVCVKMRDLIDKGNHVLHAYSIRDDSFATHKIESLQRNLGIGCGDNVAIEASSPFVQLKQQCFNKVDEELYSKLNNRLQVTESHFRIRLF